MTAYAASLTTLSTSPALSLAITPVTYPVRIARIETFGETLNYLYSNIFLYPSSVTGGTTVTPQKMRYDATAASATVKSGGSNTGTPVLMHSEILVAAASAPFNSNYQFEFELTIAAGSTLVTTLTSGTTSGLGNYSGVIVYFEEIVEDWSH